MHNNCLVKFCHRDLSTLFTVYCTSKDVGSAAAEVPAEGPGLGAGSGQAVHGPAGLGAQERVEENTGAQGEEGPAGGVAQSKMGPPQV